MHTGKQLFLLVALLGLSACGTSPSGIDVGDTGPFAPGVDHSAPTTVTEADVGHRLVTAGEFELAIRAFNRAALDNGLDAEILSGLGTANLGLGRLNQAETLLRRATTEYDPYPETLNNLGVVLMERGKTAEAVQVFRKAFALDDGESTLIRDNLRKAIAKAENSATLDQSNDDNQFKLVRRGSSDYLIKAAPEA